MKTVRKLLFYLTLVLAVLLLSATVSVFLFKDRIINQFVREANKHLNTPVKVAKIDVSIVERFPQLSIVLHDVYIEDSHEGQYPLLTAKKITFQLNPVEVYKGNYTIKGLSLEESEATLKVNAKGQNNFTIVKSNGEGANGTVTFELKNVSLKNTAFRYVDIKSNYDLEITSESLTASIKTADDHYYINAEGDVTTDKIAVEGNSYLKGKVFSLQSELDYNDNAKSLTIRPSTLQLRNSLFTVSGTYDWKEKNIINLKTEGKDTDIQTLFSLLPETVVAPLERYKSKGNVYFNARLHGEISKTKSPALTAEFGFQNATIFHPEYKTQITDANLTGSFASSDLSNKAVAALILKNIRGRLNNEPFAANFVIQNFRNPEVICDFKGRVDAASVLDFYPVKEIRQLQGHLVADIAFEGKIELLKNKTTAQRVATRGTIDLQNLQFDYGTSRVPVRNLNGALQFNNNDLALSNVAGTLGKSDFILNGFFKNIITFLLFENQPIGIETDLSSQSIDLDELFSIAFGSTEGNEPYQFNISRNLYLNFNCDVKRLRYKRFRAQSIKGDLLVKNQAAVSRNLSLKTMGGSLSLSGILDAHNPRAIDIVCTSRLSNIRVDSVFYVFENFNQTFIEDKHLKGSATADVNMELTLNQHLKLFPETLVADIRATIKNGELNNFEPMKKLNRFLDDEGLNKLRFSDLQNDIHIEKKTIYIPQMEVRSNVTDIKISGTHTFDQQIDYRLITPLRGKRKVSDNEAKGAIEIEQSGVPKLYLKITGTTDNYRVMLDTEAVKNKIISDLKREVKELKDAFKNKGTQKKKEAELEKDEYFDWDND